MMLASHIAESYLLLEHAQSLALSDDISGLPNHRAAQTVLGEKINKSLKEQAPLVSSLWMVITFGSIITSATKRGTP